MTAALTATPDVTADLLTTADELYGTSTPLDQLLNSILTIHHTSHDSDQLANLTASLFAEDGALALLALAVKAKADSPAVQNLPADRRHAAKAALRQIAAELTDLSRSGLAETAAYNLNPA
ncbi:hypothetical protein [Streptomyces sp. NPDC048516]|uniref:hypothetical protein n=1 Tax=Streptomyces sp. NPDC048516 TaxID=3365565 RepID=UPI00371A3EDC